MKAMALIIFVALVAAGCVQKHSYLQEGEFLTLLYRDSKAKEILFASSLDGYSYHAATKTNNDTWKISLPLEKEFNYFYIVDGVVTIPDCRHMEYDDFGSKNCLFVYGM
jgi:hypothetical protein